MKLAMPNITPAQILSIVVAVFGVLAAFGLPLSEETEDAIIQLVSILCGSLVVGDAGIRIGRSRALLRPDTEKSETGEGLGA